VIGERFEIIREIGEGGMGIVYEAFDRKRNQRIAIKSAKLGFRRLLTPELESALKVRHPNICLVNEIHSATTEYGEVDFLTMEFLDGQTLSGRLSSSGALQHGEALEIARQLCSALSEAHLSGVIHRDLKSANVILCRSGDETRSVITDFGLATEATLDPSELAGTPGYMAPELWRGDRPSTASDIYALGVILYEMITGVKPFTGQKTKSRLTICPVAPSAWTEPMDSRWDAAILRCLDPSPSARPKDAKEVLALLERRPLPPLIDRLTDAWTTAKPVTRRIWRIVALLAMVLLAVGAATLARLFMVVPRPTDAMLTDKDTIVLADLTNTTGDTVFDGALRQALAVKLQESPYFNVVSDQRMDTTLRLMGQPPGAPITPTVGRDICVRTASRAMITGSIAKLANRYVLTLHGSSCATGKTFAQSEHEGQGNESVMSALGKASADLRRKLGEPASIQQQFDRPLEEATTSSIEAWRAYSVGWKTLAGKGAAEAVTFFKRAIEVDPDFAMAHSALGVAYYNLGKVALASRSFDTAFRLRDRLTRRERFFITVNYYKLVTGELDRARAANELWIEAYPRDAAAHSGLGNLYASLGQPEKAVREMSEAIRLDPDFAYAYGNLAALYAGENRLDDAKKTLALAQARKLDAPNLHLASYVVGSLEGNSAAISKEIGWAREDPGERDELYALRAGTEAHSGRLQDSMAFFQLAVESARDAGKKDAAGLWMASEALQMALLGQPKEARKEALDALRAASTRDVEATAGMALARAGDEAAAMSVVHDLERHFPLDTTVLSTYVPSIQGQIELNRGNATRAIEVLRRAEPYDLAQLKPASGFVVPVMYPVLVRGEAYMASKQARAAAAEFHKISTHGGLVVNSPIDALGRLGLARAYTLAGDFRARLRYVDFLKLWKDADRDVAMVRMAKAEHEELDYLPLFDRFSKGEIDSKKWSYFTMCPGCARELRDGHLRLMARAFGPSSIDKGVSHFTSGQGLLTDRASIDMVQFRFAINSFSSTPCPTNAAAATSKLSFQGHFFNSGTWDVFDDMAASVVVAHGSNDKLPSTSLSVSGVLQTRDQIVSRVDLGTVEVGEPATASIRWDQENKVFVVQLARTQTVPLVVEHTMPYKQRDDTHAANPFKQFVAAADVPNCTSAKSFASIDSRIDWVRVSHSATD
jgi:tetratricopeptide (TPR) repeat protein